MNGATLDAGALIAFERSKRPAVLLLLEMVERADAITIPAGVVGQVWRDGTRQVPLVRLLGSDVVEVVPLDDQAARAAGQLCGVTGTSDVIDASVVLCARERGQKILTSDAADLRRIDPDLDLIPI